MGSPDDQRQRARPELVRERQKGVGNIPDQRDSLLDRIDQDRQRLRFRASLDAENALDGGKVEWIGRKAVDGIRRYRNHTASPNETCGVFDCLPVGRFR